MPKKKFIMLKLVVSYMEDDQFEEFVKEARSAVEALLPKKRGKWDLSIHSWGDE